MNENELLEFNYKNPNNWCKIGTKISGFNNDAVIGIIVDLDESKTKVYVAWNEHSLNSLTIHPRRGGYRKYNRDYLNKEITKGNIKVFLSPN
jgi:hypothetical protein